MKIPERLIDCLNESKAGYEILHHPGAVTAQRIAQAEHVKGRHYAKVVMVKSGEQHVMAVLSADHQPYAAAPRLHRVALGRRRGSQK